MRVRQRSRRPADSDIDICSCFLYVKFGWFWSLEFILVTATMSYHQTSTETFVISMLPQDGDWRFRCESDHAKRFEKLCLQAFGSHAQMKQWDELVNWLAFCMTVLGLLGFWAQTLKEFNMLQLNKDSMQGQYVSTWSQDESRPKTSKNNRNLDQQKDMQDCAYVQNQCQSIKLKGTELDALNSIALSGHARAADPGQPCVFFVSLTDIKRPSQGIRDWFGEEKEVSRPVLLLCRYRFVQYPGVWFATCCTSMVLRDSQVTWVSQ